MTKLYTIEELLQENINQNVPTDFLKNENIPNLYKEVFNRNASGEIFSKEELSKEEAKDYTSDVKRIIYNPDILRYIWNYRLEQINNNIDNYTVQKYLSEVIQYLFVYMKEIKLVKTPDLKPDFDGLNHEWAVKAQTVIERIKLDIENLYINNQLPNTLFTTETNDGIGLLTTRLNEKFYIEIPTVAVLNQIGIKGISEDLLTSNKR